MDNGTIAIAERSCYDFWKPLVDEDEASGYKERTLEEPEDRVDGCLFRREARYAENLARFDAIPRRDARPPSIHTKLLSLYLHAQERDHARAFREIKAGRKTSHWLWWEWPAFSKVRSTSRPEYDLPSCAACESWSRRVHTQGLGYICPPPRTV